MNTACKPYPPEKEAIFPGRVFFPDINETACTATPGCRH